MTRAQLITDAARRASQRTAVRLALVGIACAAGAALAWTGLDWSVWVQDWIGRLFRAGSGAVLGLAFSRYVLRLDLSALPEARRGLPGIAQALCVVGGMVAVG